MEMLLVWKYWGLHRHQLPSTSTLFCCLYECGYRMPFFLAVCGYLISKSAYLRCWLWHEIPSSDSRAWMMSIYTRAVHMGLALSFFSVCWFLSYSLKGKSNLSVCAQPLQKSTVVACVLKVLSIVWLQDWFVDWLPVQLEENPPLAA